MPDPGKNLIQNFELDRYFLSTNKRTIHHFLKITKTIMLCV